MFAQWLLPKYPRHVDLGATNCNSDRKLLRLAPCATLKTFEEYNFLASLSFLVIWELETGKSMEEDGGREHGGGRVDVEHL